MKKKYNVPVVKISDEQFTMSGTSAEIEPGTAIVAGAGITTGAAATGAIIAKHCW